jgi:hypothetical protein
MKISRTKFVLLFLICGFAFLFISNVLFGPDVRLLPQDGESFMGTGSQIGWKRIVSTVLYPVKIILVGPMLPLINLPDPPPPFLVIGFACYWTALALSLHYLLRKIKQS